jgi:hypothetical protein
MKNFFKFLLKWGIRIIIISILLFGGTVYFLYNPSFIFDYETKYKNFEIYSDVAIEKNIGSLLEQVKERVSEIEIYNPNYAPKIFLISDTDTYERIAFLSFQNKYSQAFNLTLLGNIFVNVPLVNKINLNHDPEFTYTLMEGKLDQVLAHQFIHAFIAERLGYIQQLRIPEWKVEGYCEYASTINEIKRKRGASIVKRAKALYNYDVSEVNTNSVFYYRSHLLVEYLSEIHHISFDQLTELPADYDALTKEFSDWYLLESKKRK